MNRNSNTVGFVSPVATGTASVTLGGSGFTCSRGVLGGRSEVRCGVAKRGAAWRTRRESKAFSTVRCTATTMDVTSETFDAEVLSCDIPVVVDFYAPWCGPCKLMTPLMDWAAAEYDGQVKMVKIDTEENDGFVKQFEIYGLPTFAVFINGDARAIQEGAMSKAVFSQYIQKHAFS